jgi:hypothetical protein
MALNSIDHIRDLVERLLVKANAMDAFPTPVDAIVRAAELERSWPTAQDLRTYVAGLEGEAASTLLSGWPKILGWQTGSLFGVHPTLKGPDLTRVVFHEVAHRMLPHHRVSRESLTPEMRRILDDEADLFASELVFKGRRFLKTVATISTSFKSAVHLAALHDAPVDLTLDRLVRCRPGNVALLAQQGDAVWTVLAASPDYDPRDVEGSIPIESRQLGRRRYVLARGVDRYGSRRFAA